MADARAPFFSTLPVLAKIIFVLAWPISLTYAVYRMWRNQKFATPVRIAITLAAVIFTAAVLAPAGETPAPVVRDTEQSAASQEATATPSDTARTAEPTPIAPATPVAEQPATPASAVQVTAASVIRVVDGDTAEVRMPDGTTEKVRFIGVDTPECTTGTEPYGKEASAFTQEVLANKTVYLETDVELRDRYGRLLAHVWLETPTEISDDSIRAHLFNAQLVLAGYANLMTIPPNVKYVEYLKGYEAEARDASAGLWGLPAEPSSQTQPTNPQPSSPTAAYIANSNTGKFHYADCSSVDDMSESNKVPYSSRDAAIADGYVPCKRCNP